MKCKKNGVMLVIKLGERNFVSELINMLSKVKNGEIIKIYYPEKDTLIFEIENK